MRHTCRVRRHQGAADLLDQIADVGGRPWSAGHERRVGGAGQQAEHQVRRAGLAPEVVERDDVRVLEPGDDLRLGFEPAYELFGIGDPGPDHLDRHAAVRPRLHGRVHAAG